MRDRAYVVYGELSNFGRALRRLLPVIAGVAILMPLLMLWLRPKGVPTFAVGLLVVGPAVLRALLLTRRDFLRLAPRAGEVADAFLDEGICPCCAYNLAGVVSAGDPDAIVRCTECGAVWERRRIRRVLAEETAETREPVGWRSIMRAQAMIYAPLGFKDDAGASTSFVRYGDLRALRDRASGDFRTRLSDCVAQLRFRGLWLRLLFVSLVLPGTIAILFDFSRRPLASLGLWQALQALGVLTWVIGGLAVLGSDMGRAGPKRAELLKSRRVCPSCGGDLASMPQSGTPLPCPECRSAWLLPVTEPFNAADAPDRESR